MAQTSVGNLRVYQLACSLEDQVYKLIKKLPEDQAYGLANNLRRSSAGVAHFINESHKRYSFQVKIEALHGARIEAESTQKLLVEFSEAGHGQTKGLQEEYTGVIKQLWGLIKYLKNKRAELDNKAVAQAKDELVETKAI